MFGFGDEGDTLDDDNRGLLLGRRRGGNRNRDGSSNNRSRSGCGVHGIIERVV